VPKLRAVEGEAELHLIGYIGPPRKTIEGHILLREESVWCETHAQRPMKLRFRTDPAALDRYLFIRGPGGFCTIMSNQLTVELVHPDSEMEVMETRAEG
jgi:hypothetical protein